MDITYYEGEFWIDDEKANSEEQIGKALCRFMSKSKGFNLELHEPTFVTSARGQNIKVQGSKALGYETKKLTTKK